MSSDRSLTPEEVAGMLNIAKTTVYEMIKRGELPCYRIGRKMRIEREDIERYRRTRKQTSAEPIPATYASLPAPDESAVAAQRSGSIILAGQDILLDMLGRHLESRLSKTLTLRSYLGSYNGLVALYRGEVDAASVHLWDEIAQSYNTGYIPHLLPGTSCTLIHLAKRQVGLYVRKGNPKNIRGWADFSRSDITMINREKGSGVRVLLDQKLRTLGITTDTIKGYARESQTHLAVASIVSQGGADAGVGSEKTALQFREIEFIPLQTERYDLVFKTASLLLRPELRTLADLVTDPQFLEEASGIEGYDLSETGDRRVY
jgi:putative molybdopterin biosynthesis protein